MFNITHLPIFVLSQSILPYGYEKKFCAIIEREDGGFEATFLLKINNEDEFYQWINDFQKSSLGRFRLRPNGGNKAQFYRNRVFTVIKYSLLSFICNMEINYVYVLFSERLKNNFRRNTE